MARATPLSFGSAGHAGLAALFDGKTQDEIKKAVFAEYTPDEIQESGSAPLVALEAVNAFNKHVDWRSWGVIQNTEPYFEVRVDRAQFLHGYFDGLIKGEDSKMRYILENKFVSSIDESYLDHLLWDDQAGYYIMAARQLGFPVVGCLYNLIRKPSIRQGKATPIEARKFTKDGKLYANQRETDEPDADYVMRVREWYEINKGEAFVKHLVMRSEAQLEALAARFGQIVSDLRDCNRNNAYYANGEACAIRGCPYASVCLEDTPEVRQGNFTSRLEAEERRELKKKIDEAV